MRLRLTSSWAQCPPIGSDASGIAPNVSRLGEVAEHKTSIVLQTLNYR